jgi:hypothetical protein
VKTTQPKPSRRRARASSLVAREAAPDLREVLVHLTDDELRALDEARQALGTAITLEQMIHRVFAEWMLRMKTPAMPATRDVPLPASRDLHMIARLRELAASPLRTWRELTATVRRFAGLSK